MKLLVLAVVSIALSKASSLQPDQIVLGDLNEVERYLIELEPGITRWVTEDEKWALRRVCQPCAGLDPASSPASALNAKKHPRKGPISWISQTVPLEDHFERQKKLQ